MSSCEFTLQTDIKIKPTDGQLSGCCSVGSVLKVLTYDFPSFSKGGNASPSRRVLFQSRIDIHQQSAEGSGAVTAEQISAWYGAGFCAGIGWGETNAVLSGLPVTIYFALKRISSR